jgi:hypothetical protein
MVFLFAEDGCSSSSVLLSEAYVFAFYTLDQPEFDRIDNSGALVVINLPIGHL